MSDQENEQESTPEYDSRAYQLAHLAAVMMSYRIREKDLGIADGNLSNPTWDPDFDGALKRADMLLRKAQGRDFQVSAYQVFREGEMMSLEQIAGEFKAIGWPRLHAKATVKKLLETMEGEMNSFIGLIKKHPEREAQLAFDQIREGLEEIGQLDEVKAHYPKFAEDADWFLETLDRDPEAKKVPPTLRQEFLDWCFITEQRGKKEVRKFRPHEIFRFCDSFTAMPDVPKASLRELSEGYRPFPAKSMWPLEFPMFEAREDGFRKEGSDTNP